MLITLHADDLLIAGSPKHHVMQPETRFCKQARMKDCRKARICLDIEIARDRQAQVLQMS